MKLVCPDCRRENEPERIYCHDCGARLDRSALAKKEPKEEDPKETQRRLRTMLDPNRAKLRKRFFQGGKLILGALVAAAIVQILRAPDLPEDSPTLDLPPHISLDLESATGGAGTSAPLRYSEEQVNSYLSNLVKSRKIALSKYLQFDRAIVGLDEGSCWVTAQRSLLGLSVYTTASFVPKIANATLVARARSGRIGRLPVHPAIMQAVGGYMFGDLRGVLERDRKQIAKLGAIELHEKQLILIPKQS